MSSTIIEASKSLIDNTDSSSTILNVFLKMGTFATLLLSVLACFIIWYAQFRWSRRRLYELCAKIPQCKGNLSFISLKHKVGDSEEWLRRLRDACKHGTPVVGWVAYMPVIFIHRPEDIEIVLNSPKSLGKHYIYDIFKVLMGNGLFTAPVPIWKFHRKIITPTFNQKILNQFFTVFVQQSEILCDVLKNDLGKFFDITVRLNHWSLDSICETALGVKMECQLSDNQLVSSIHNLMETAFDRVFNIMSHNDFIYLTFLPVGRRQKKKIDYIKGFVNEILQQKYETIRKKQQDKMENMDAEISDEKKFLTTLDMLIEANEQKAEFTDQDLLDETTTMMLAGSETSATSIGYMLMLIALFPDVQKKVYDEIIDVLGHQRQMTVTDLPYFTYLDRVIKESLRLFPLGPFVLRQAEEDLDIKNYTLPKEAAICISIMEVHRSAEYWPDPLKFDPDRFLPEQVAKRHPYAYIPFLAGPRICIGHKYAMMSIKALLVVLLRKYYIETPIKSIEEIRLKQDVALRPVDGFKVKLTERDLE